MSASGHSFSRSALPYTPLTITEVDLESPPVLGSSRIYFFAAAGTALGVLVGVSIAMHNWIPRWLPLPTAGIEPASITTAVQQQAPRGPRKFGAARALAAGLNGHLTTEWNGKPLYQLDIEPADLTRLPGFAMAVTNSPRPLSVAFQLLDNSGTVLCSQEVILRYDAARAAARYSAGANAAVASPEAPQAPVNELEAQEHSREQGRDMFDIGVNKDGKIEAINAQGQMVCSKQAYEKAVSWNLSPDFPSVSEQSELLKEQPEPASETKPTAPKKVSSLPHKPEVDGLAASLNGLPLPKSTVQ